MQTPSAQFGLISINRRAVVALKLDLQQRSKEENAKPNTLNKCCRLQFFPVRAVEHLRTTAGEIMKFPGSSSQMFQMVARNKEINGEPLRKAAGEEREGGLLTSCRVVVVRPLCQRFLRRGSQCKRPVRPLPPDRSSNSRSRNKIACSARPATDRHCWTALSKARDAPSRRWRR